MADPIHRGRIVQSLILTLFLPGAAHSQTGLGYYGGSMVLPNYERIPVGEREALEAGAYVARTRDGNANWYNPAGLALSERTAVNASASAYEGNSLEFRTFEFRTSALRFATLGGFFGVSVAEPLAKSPNVRYGFYVARPLAWQSGTIDATADDQQGRFALLSAAIFARTEPGIAAGFRLNEKLRVGGALGVSVTSLDESQDIAVRRDDADSASTTRRTIVFGATAWHLVARGGVQWDPSENIRLGLVASAPGLQIVGGTQLDYTFGDYGASRYVDETLRDTEADFDLKLPFNVGMGVATLFDRGEVEIAIRHYGSSQEHDLMTSTVAGRRVENLAGQPPVVTAFVVDPIRNEWRSVTNVAVGGNVSLNDKVRIHLGFQTDTSPVPEAGNAVFRKVNLIGVTTGVSFTTQHFGGTIGLGYSTGESDPVQSLDSSGGIVETRLRVSSIRVMYSLAAKF